MPHYIVQFSSPVMPNVIIESATRKKALDDAKHLTPFFGDVVTKNDSDAIQFCYPMNRPGISYPVFSRDAISALANGGAVKEEKPIGESDFDKKLGGWDPRGQKFHPIDFVKMYQKKHALYPILDAIALGYQSGQIDPFNPSSVFKKKSDWDVFISELESYDYRINDFWADFFDHFATDVSGSNADIAYAVRCGIEDLEEE